MTNEQHEDHPFTKRQLISDLGVLGVGPGRVVMAHTSVKSLGPVMGGPTTLMQALLDTITSTGTVMVYVGWENLPDDVNRLAPAIRDTYYGNHPPFDPAIARAVRDHGMFAELVRTWPGAQRSDNPEASMVAVGAQATWLTQDHPLNYGYGLDSPLDKLVRLDGQVLLLGSPLENITLLHYAENRANLRHKNIVRYPCPILRDGQRIWIDIEDFNTSDPHGDYTFEQIARDYLASGAGRTGKVGQAQCHLFDAAPFAEYAIAWLEARYGA
jgi:aminoglycoside 3-N-acetyltransferase